MLLTALRPAPQDGSGCQAALRFIQPGNRPICRPTTNPPRSNPNRSAGPTRREATEAQTRRRLQVVTAVFFKRRNVRRGYTPDPEGHPQHRVASAARSPMCKGHLRASGRKAPTAAPVVAQICPFHSHFVKSNQTQRTRNRPAPGNRLQQQHFATRLAAAKCSPSDAPTRRRRNGQQGQ